MPNFLKTEETGSDLRHDAYDDSRPLLMNCACGRVHRKESLIECTDSARVSTLQSHSVQSVEQTSQNFMEAAFVKAMFPVDSVRRGFLRAVGANTARAAIGSVLPLGALQAMAQDKGSIEKKDLKIGFIAITCASPLIMAEPLGFYRKEGLNVQLMKTAGWALICTKGS